MKKGGRRISSTSSSGPRPSPARAASLLPIAALLLAGLFLRTISFDSDIGGFLAWNEANYLLVARNASLQSVLFPSLGGGLLFLETPPLVPYLIALLSWGSEPGVLVGRIVAIAFSLALILATWRLARLFFSSRAALVAAAIAAVAPVAVVVGANIQTDSAYLALTVIAIECYARARQSENESMIPFGVAIGLAALTKLFALVALPALLLWELQEGSLRKAVRDRRRWKALLVGLAPFAAFYVFHVLRAPALARSLILGGAAQATTFPRSVDAVSALGVEAIWVFSPLIAVVLVAGVGAALRRPSSGERLMLSLTLAYGVFYLFFHKHSYYLLAMLPFAAILAGRFVDKIRSNLLRRLSFGAIVASGAFFSAIDVTGMKLGFSEIRRLADTVRAFPEPVGKVVAEGVIVDNSGIVLGLYIPGLQVWRIPDAPPGHDGERVIIPPDSKWLLFSASPRETEASGLLLFARDRYALELFGWSIAEAHENPNYFRQGRYQFLRTGHFWSFGFPVLRTVPALGLGAIEPGDSLHRLRGGIEVRGP